MIRLSAASPRWRTCTPRFNGTASKTAKTRTASSAGSSFLPVYCEREASIRRTLQWRRS
jgi:hypothetical protein